MLQMEIKEYFKTANDFSEIDWKCFLKSKIQITYVIDTFSLLDKYVD